MTRIVMSPDAEEAIAGFAELLSAYGNDPDRRAQVWLSMEDHLVEAARRSCISMTRHQIDEEISGAMAQIDERLEGLSRFRPHLVSV